MSPSRLERESPSEWLLWLAEAPDAYQILVAYAGGLARASYRLATAHLRLQGYRDTPPTLRELQAAAMIIAERLGTDQTLPITSLLASDADEQSLPAIRSVAKAQPKAGASRPPLRRAS